MSLTRLLQCCVAIISFLDGFGTAWAFQIKNMKTPESIIVDPQTGYYYVSNINTCLKIRNKIKFIVRCTFQFKRSRQTHAPRNHVL